jgi:hypothetical protein
MKTFYKHILAATLLSGLTLAPALAGASDSSAYRGKDPLIATYGFNVKADEALKSVIPSGWTMSVQPGAELPKTLSWEPGKPWEAIIAGWGAKYQLSVKIDEVARSVTISPPRSTGMLAGPAGVKAESSSTLGDTPMPTLNPSFYTEGSSSHGQSKGPAVSLKSPELKPVITAIADKFGYCLVDSYKKPYTLVGPVTLLGRSAKEDTALLEQAIGLYAPVAVEAFPSEKVIRIYPTRTEWAMTPRLSTQPQAVQEHCDN